MYYTNINDALGHRRLGLETVQRANWVSTIRCPSVRWCLITVVEAIGLNIALMLKICEPDLQKNHWVFLGFLFFHKTETRVTSIFFGMSHVALLLCARATIVDAVLFMFSRLKSYLPSFSYLPMMTTSHTLFPSCYDRVDSRRATR